MRGRERNVDDQYEAMLHRCWGSSLVVLTLSKCGELQVPYGLPDYIRSNQASLRLAEPTLRQRTYPFASDQGSQAGLGLTSTRLSDRPGPLSAVVFLPYSTTELFNFH